MKFYRPFAFFALLSLSLPAPGQGKFAEKTDGEFVTASGKVTQVKADSFQLKTSDQTILVEMDDYDWDADGYKLVNGDQVVISGRIDHDFLEKKKIEAGSVYVKGLNSYFFANSDDEEGPNESYYVDYTEMKNLPDNAHAHIKGKVTEISGRKATVDTGLRKIKVDTSKLIYNPLDKVGYTKISKGDTIRASGKIDQGFFGDKELVANYIVKVKKK